jgi:hypothetical protein
MTLTASSTSVFGVLLKRLQHLPLYTTPRHFPGPKMPWPFSGSSKKDDNSSVSKDTISSITDTVHNSLDAIAPQDAANNSPSRFTDPQVLIPSAAIITGTLGFIAFYKKYLRRIPSAEYIKPNVFRRRTIFGRVTAVGDADNFRIYHTPGGRWAGWGWLRHIPKGKGALVGQTVRKDQVRFTENTMGADIFMA